VIVIVIVNLEVKIWNGKRKGSDGYYGEEVKWSEAWFD
jgi:hypothetical protein